MAGPIGPATLNFTLSRNYLLSNVVASVGEVVQLTVEAQGIGDVRDGNVVEVSAVQDGASLEA